jgi:MFS family permease
VAVRRLPLNVRILALVSFLTDVASDMIYPLLPVFLSTVLGVSAAGLGLIEGFAESVSSLLRLPAGWYSDRVKRRKPLVVLGYSLAAVARPLVGLAQGMGQVMAIRITDRFGKGVRTAPRDALIADSVHETQRGYAYGLHRASDSLGSVAGPLVAWAVLTFGLTDMRGLFLWAALPGLLSVLLLVVFVKEKRLTPSVASTDATLAAESVPAEGAGREQPLGDAFRRYLLVVFIFTLSTSTDAFLLLRASQLGVTTAMVPILWAMLHVVKSVSTLAGGALSDRLGRRPMIIGGWSVYAVAYLGFALASAEWHAWALFLVYGLYFGLTEGPEKALVADLAPAARRGAAFGWFNAVVGLAALPASVVFGLVWDAYGASVAFLMGAVTACVASVLFAVMVPVKQAERMTP